MGGHHRHQHVEVSDDGRHGEVASAGDGIRGVDPQARP